MHIVGPRLTSGIILNCSSTLLIGDRASQTNPELTNMMWLVLLTSLLLGVPCLCLPRLEAQAGHHVTCICVGLGPRLLSSHLQGKHHLLSHLPNPVSFFLSFQTAAPSFRFFLGKKETFQNILFSIWIFRIWIYNLFEVGWCFHQVDYKHSSVKLLAYGTYKAQW